MIFTKSIWESLPKIEPVSSWLYYGIIFLSKNIGSASLFEGSDANEGVEKIHDASHHYERDS